LFQSPVKHGKTHSIESSIPMCVLYDMGYTLPDYQTAYLNAMDLASSALDKCVYDYYMNDFSWEELSLEESSSSSTMQQSIDTPIAPKVCHMNAKITSNEPGTMDQSFDQSLDQDQPMVT
jgi:hypothetical protein